MTTFAIFATGPSMSQEIADRARGKYPAVAVSDAFRLAPWADALVSNDKAWWRANPDAFEFAGRKFAGVQASELDGVEAVKPRFPFTSSCNSGLMAMRVARDKLGATKLLLFGFDMHGSHFFGPHKEPLRNTTPERFKVLIRQFNFWDGRFTKICEVVNLTKGSELKCFPFGEINDYL